MKKPGKEALSPTGFELFRSVIGFVNGCPETLVAAPAANHVRPGPVEGKFVLPDLSNRSLEALQGTGLFQTQSWTEIFAWRVWKRKGKNGPFPQ